MEWSAQQSRIFRIRYEQSVRTFVGNRYGENSDANRTPVNLYKLAIEIWQRFLVSQTPAVLVLTKSPNRKVDAYELELATNYFLRRTNFGKNLGDVVRSALFMMGIMKVGITTPYNMDGMGFTYESGQPYAEPVNFEDWLHDMTARRIEEWDWCGHKYRVPYEVVMENPEFDDNVKRQLNKDTKPDVATGTYTSHGEHVYGSASRLSSGYALGKTEYRPKIELWDLWLPSSNLFVTMPVQEGLPPLQIRDWSGPMSGPFHLMTFGDVPGNLVPSPPAQHLYDLQQLFTILFNHISNQATRQKTVLVVDGKAEAEGTGQTIMESSDGQVIRSENADSARELSYGGVNPGVFQFVNWLKDIFSYTGGNIDSLGGLSQQGKTLGQEQLLLESSSSMLKDWQARVISFTKRITRDIGQYLYTDPLTVLPLTKRIEGYGEIPFDYGPGRRNDSVFDYEFDLQPYSLQEQGPEQRLNNILKFATQIFIPMAPQMSEWGMNLNMQRLVELISRYSDLPEIAQLIETQVPLESEMLSQQGRMPGARRGNRPLQSPVTQRNYTRENVSTGGNQQSQNMELMKSLLRAEAESKS